MYLDVLYVLAVEIFMIKLQVVMNFRLIAICAKIDLYVLMHEEITEVQTVFLHSCTL